MLHPPGDELGLAAPLLIELRGSHRRARRRTWWWTSTPTAPEGQPAAWWSPNQTVGGETALGLLKGKAAEGSTQLA